jgi:hypothetical protein
MHFVLIEPYGDYAEDRANSIATIARLPEWIRERFSVPNGAPGARASSRRTS